MWAVHPPQTLYILNQSRALISTVPSVPQATTKKKREGRNLFATYKYVQYLMDFNKLLNKVASKKVNSIL